MRFFRSIAKNDASREKAKDQSEDGKAETGPRGVMRAVPDLKFEDELKIGTPVNSGPEGEGEKRGDSNGHVAEVAPDAGRVRFEGEDSAEKLKKVDLSERTESLNPHIVAIANPTSPYAEEYRSLRTSVIQTCRDQAIKSIVVTSLEPGEGKSVTAVNLAWLLAQTSGTRTLLVDGDMRRPSLAQYLGLRSDNGLADVLTGGCRLEDVLIYLQPAGLFLLPGSESKGDPADLISGPEFLELKREAEKVFDFVVYDSPPMCVFSDASAMIDKADGALLVIGANKASGAKFERTLATVPKEKMIGSVLNMADETPHREYYYHPYYRSLNED